MDGNLDALFNLGILKLQLGETSDGINLISKSADKGNHRAKEYLMIQEYNKENL